MAVQELRVAQPVGSTLHAGGDAVQSQLYFSSAGGGGGAGVGSGQPVPRRSAWHFVTASANQ
jgi:hypothetical protein